MWKLADVNAIVRCDFRFSDWLREAMMVRI